MSDALSFRATVEATREAQARQAARIAELEAIVRDIAVHEWIRWGGDYDGECTFCGAEFVQRPPDWRIQINHKPHCLCARAKEVLKMTLAEVRSVAEPADGWGPDHTPENFVAVCATSRTGAAGESTGLEIVVHITPGLKALIINGWCAATINSRGEVMIASSILSRTEAEALASFIQNGPAANYDERDADPR